MAVATTHGSDGGGSQAQMSPGTYLLTNAGKPGSGKSTAWNNLLGLQLQTGDGPYSVTDKVLVHKLSGTNIKLVVVDVPGLEACDIPSSQVLADIHSRCGNLESVLLYCHRVDCRCLKDDKRIMKTLTVKLGGNVWKKCVVLLTFSDNLRGKYQRKEDRESYKDALRKHVAALSCYLAEVGGDSAPKVKLVYDVDRSRSCIEEIVAVPVGCSLHHDKERYILIPGLEGCAHWVFAVWEEICRKADPVGYSCKVTKKEIIDGCAAGSFLGGVGGGVMGGVSFGLAFGLVSGGVLAIPGVIAGGVIGGVVAGSVLGGGVGLGSGVGLTTIHGHFKKKKALKRAEQLSDVYEVSEEDMDPARKNILFHYFDTGERLEEFYREEPEL